MKANVPKKLYLIQRNGLISYCRNNEDDAEYILTDAFIGKACEWIEEFNNHHHIMRYSDSCEPPLSELTEWFKNYMKGE